MILWSFFNCFTCIGPSCIFFLEKRIKTMFKNISNKSHKLICATCYKLLCGTYHNPIGLQATFFFFFLYSLFSSFFFLFFSLLFLLPRHRPSLYLSAPYTVALHIEKLLWFHQSDPHHHCQLMTYHASKMKCSTIAWTKAHVQKNVIGSIR